MTLPVLLVAGATLRDLLRFPLRHPSMVLIATICAIPINYRLVLVDLAGQDAPSLQNFGASWLLSVLSAILWLPLCLLAIREVVSGRAVDFRIGAPSVASLRYGAYNIVALSIMLVISSSVPASPVIMVAKLVFAIVLSWLLLRTTLAFSALALGRQDLGLAQSIARTDGLTWRLLAVVVLPGAATMAGIVGIMIAMTGGMDVADGDAYIYPLTFAGVASQGVVVGIAIAGAHVYRLLDGTVPQNGRYW